MLWVVFFTKCNRYVKYGDCGRNMAHGMITGTFACR